LVPEFALNKVLGERLGLVTDDVPIGLVVLQVKLVVHVFEYAGIEQVPTLRLPDGEDPTVTVALSLDVPPAPLHQTVY
jgi:Ethanolamine utilization protein EutJ (predicted chaperonin)